MELKPGQLVTSKAGRDFGTRYLVLAQIDARMVLVVDGKGRGLAKPKRKNLRHLQVHAIVEPNLTRKCQDMTITDAEIRHYLRQFEKVLASENGESEVAPDA